jgi:hypothetical protein
MPHAEPVVQRTMQSQAVEVRGKEIEGGEMLGGAKNAS